MILTSTPVDTTTFTPTSRSVAIKRPWISSLGSLEEELSHKNKTLDYKPKYYTRKEAWHVDLDILKKKTLQQQHLKDLRVLLKFKKIKGKSLEDQKHFPTRSRHTTNLANAGGG